MNSEFEKLSANAARSSRGFTVVWRPPGGVDYTDASGTIRVDAEMLVRPPPAHLHIFPRSASLRAMSENRAQEVIDNIVRALEAIGHTVEKW
jgi:hypothetical protein